MTSPIVFPPLLRGLAIRFNPAARSLLTYPTAFTEDTCADAEAKPAAPSTAAISSVLVLIALILVTVCLSNLRKRSKDVNAFFEGVDVYTSVALYVVQALDNLA